MAEGRRDVERALGRRMTPMELHVQALSCAWIKATTGPEKEATARALDAVSPTTRREIQATMDRMTSGVKRTMRLIIYRLTAGLCPNCGSSEVVRYPLPTVEDKTHGCYACRKSFVGSPA